MLFFWTEYFIRIWFQRVFRESLRYSTADLEGQERSKSASDWIRTKKTLGEENKSPSGFIPLMVLLCQLKNDKMIPKRVKRIRKRNEVNSPWLIRIWGMNLARKPWETHGRGKRATLMVCLSSELTWVQQSFIQLLLAEKSRIGLLFRV